MKFHMILICAIAFIHSALYGQEGMSPPPDPLLALHEVHEYDGIKHRRFTLEDLMPVVEKLKNHPDFMIEEAGRSVQGRPVFYIKWGEGPVDVLLWSQMHGDEPTATMALADIFQYLMEEDDPDGLKATLSQRTTLHFIPLLNPDGAEVYQRRNALDIDLNRDALRLVSPESRILKEYRDKIDPAFGFNLHDQSRYYTSGPDGAQASISFLAPAFNEQKDINGVRFEAIQLIGFCNDWLQDVLPGRVGRYDDTFEPRAFGDNIQKWGTSTVLIESGGLPGDREKQYLRKVHFALILRALESIGKGTYRSYSLSDYEAIPENHRYLHDLVVRNARVETQGGKYVLDLAFQHNEVEYGAYPGFSLRSSIADIGDLSTYRGYIDLDLAGYDLVPAKAWPQTIMNPKELKRLNKEDLARDGYLYIKYGGALSQKTHYPVLIGPKSEMPQVVAGNNPALLIYDGDKLAGFIANGHVYRYSDADKNPTLVEEPTHQQK